MENIFICYSHLDRDFALKLIQALKDSGKDVWIDRENLGPSTIWRTEIEEAIEGAVAFIFLLSIPSIQSAYCTREFEYAQKLKKKIIPILLPGITQNEVPEPIEKIQWLRWVDFGSDLTHLDQLQEGIETDYE